MRTEASALLERGRWAIAEKAPASASSPGDVSLTSLPEHTVQQPGRAEQPDMARMKRRDRSSILHLFSRQEEGRDLPPRGGGENDVLDLVQRQATIDKWRRSRGWHTVGCFGAGQSWHRVSPRHLHRQCAIAIVLLAANALPHAEERDLIEPRSASGSVSRKIRRSVKLPASSGIAESNRSCRTTISSTPPSTSQRNVCSRKRYSIRLLPAEPISES
jgi:hypothetical protein